MPMLLTDLSERDRLTVAYVTGCLHRLTFQDDPTEQAKGQACLQKDLQQLYEAHKIPGQELVAYKGGHIEKDALKQHSSRQFGTLGVSQV